MLKGFILDKKSKKPIVYANIGIVSSMYGCISNEKGYYSLHLPSKIDSTQSLRFSMLGYQELYLPLFKAKKLDTILLEKKDIELEEVVLSKNNLSKKRKLGTFKKSKYGICGWGGNKFGSGHEIGLLIDLGENHTKIEKLHLYIHHNSFEKSLLRLHIRDLKNELPNKDLLCENILIPVTKKSGWINVDLTKYKIYTNGKIAVTIEWISAQKGIEKRKININKTKEFALLLSVNQKTGTFFIRKGSEMPWKIIQNQSPNMYIEVKQ